MFTDIYLVSRIVRNTATMSNVENSRVTHQKAFENLNDALRYFEHLQEELLDIGFELKPSIFNNFPIFGKVSLPYLTYKSENFIVTINVKFIPLMKEA